MTRTAKIALLAGVGVALLAAGAAAAQTVDDYGVAQPRTGVTGIGINDAAPAEVTREGGYIPPGEAQRRIGEGTLSADNLLTPPAPVPAPAPAPMKPAPAVTMPSIPTQSAAGLTSAQLDDADVVNFAGAEIGEVEAVLLDPAGQPVSVLVELDDDMFVDPGLVEIALADLRARTAGNYTNIWSDRLELVSDRPTSWFEAAHDWRDGPRFGVEAASR